MGVERQQPSFDPNRLPHLDVTRERKRFETRYGGNDRIKHKPDPTANRILADMLNKHQHLISGERLLEKADQKYKYTNDPHPAFDVVVGLPIAVEVEPQEKIRETVLSLKEAAQTLDGTKLIIVHLNYAGDQRRDEAEITGNHQRSTALADEIAGILDDEKIELLVVEDYLPQGTTMTQIRNRLLAWTGQKMEIYPYTEKVVAMHNTPFVMVDTDTTIAKDSLQQQVAILKNDQAVFVNGRVRYTGGVMDLPVDEVAQEETNSKLIYFVEMMRRRMFEHLPPEASHGYLPETGVAAKFGVLVTLGFFNVHSAQNETYFVQLAAIEALRNSWRVKKPESDRTPTITHARPYISSSVADHIESLVHYGSYSVDTSIRSIENMVRLYGRNALLTFDQGSKYRMWTETADMSGKTVEPEWNREQTFAFLNRVYSYFKECGGVLRFEDLIGEVALEDGQTDVDRMNLNDLLKSLFPSENDSRFWIPR